ncbi:GNAT family N-acetyltransferase [Caldalkalibacillus mannanilyticus]|uniref:GNAT family N-acetyltransferase n=1 Tax=Caldalkalibacillus mannanilyticus TaxID=1418 RepID=UPI000469A386|nr:GNAT family N-acetyltransferase [Caldalkalibacillus mannanilyticus]
MSKKSVLESPSIVRVQRKDHAQVINIWSNAFVHDPLFQSLFPEKNRVKQLQQFFHFICMKNISLNELLLGVTDNRDLRGAASIELPNSTRGAGLLLQPAFVYHALKLMVHLPKGSRSVLQAYMQYTTKIRPKEPHHYLVCIGVEPRYHGQGVGKVLLQYIHDLVDADPLSTGIGLDTENMDNVQLYEHFGYHLIESKTLGEITIYGMFRPKHSIYRDK